MTGETQLQHRVLESLASARNYIGWLAALVLPYLGDDPVEIGSGTGDYAEAWLTEGVTRLTLTELDPELLVALQTRFAGDTRVAVRRLDVSSAGEGHHSAAVSLNVLEHIQDDVAALLGARDLVRGGGTVVALVPALELAMSRFDRAIGHHRRYSKRTLGLAFDRAGLPVERIEYVNAPGLLAWIVGMKWLRGEPHEGPLLTAWDRFVIPATRRLESVKAPPLGQSLLAVGRVPH